MLVDGFDAWLSLLQFSFVTVSLFSVGVSPRRDIYSNDQQAKEEVE
jgi:hypothetical protein